jgi:DDE superfamily endonuclease
VAAPWSVHPSAPPAYPDPPVALARLQAFRAELHACCTRRADALVDLADALLSAQGPVSSLPHLSLEPAHRRGWGSTYAALARGRIDPERLRGLLARHPLAGGQPVYAVDVTAWPRCDAECSPERGLYYHPSRHSAGQPIVAGWAFQWICQLGFARDSWTAPVDARRLHPTEDPDHTAAVQIRALLGRLPTTRQPPLVVFDAGYDSAQLSLDLAEAPVAVLVRLRSDRCFYHDPPPRPPGTGGRPRRHGAKFAFADPTTWPIPTATHVAHDDQYGTVTVAAWAGLHPKQHRHPGHGTRGPRPIVRGTILRVQVQRVPPVPARPRCCGCGGPAPAACSWTWTLRGGRMSAGSTWSTPSGSASRRWAGPPHARGIPPRPTGGPGWCWPPIPSCAWPASSLQIHGCRGSGPAHPASCPPTGSAGGFRACCARSGRRPPRRNPPGAPPAGPRATDLVPPCATRWSRSPPPSPPTSPGRSRPGLPDRRDQYQQAPPIKSAAHSARQG